MINKHRSKNIPLELIEIIKYILNLSLDHKYPRCQSININIKTNNNNGYKIPKLRNPYN